MGEVSAHIAGAGRMREKKRKIREGFWRLKIWDKVVLGQKWSVQDDSATLCNVLLIGWDQMVKIKSKKNGKST